MLKTLNTGAIGVSAGTLTEGLAAAKSAGFEGLEFNPAEISLLGPQVAEDKFYRAGVKPACFGLPIDWRNDEQTWQNDLANLPELARAAASIACTRCATWVLPGSNERETEENIAWHVARFQPIAAILNDYGISLGLEFIGPKTLRDQFKYPFPHTIAGMLEVAEQIGPNVGLLVDSFHWFTSHGTVEDLLRLRPEQVVHVHVNDAAAGVEADEQIDGIRRLPGATGVIDIAAFLQALRQIGYDGPVTAEPFDASLAELPSDEDRLRATKASLDLIFSQAGL